MKDLAYMQFTFNLPTWFLIAFTGYLIIYTSLDAYNVHLKHKIHKLSKENNEIRKGLNE